ncbi:MAG: glycosyltransferase family 4 protein [Nocardioides sp.]|uniref:glycosyltransferase family 4 protein n=1 Tax=Nocardioides sp. TaxID=35761 RepID=UPI0039E6ADA1
MNTPLTVTLVTQWFPPEPVTVPMWIARSLKRGGLDVRVLTGMPNYPDGVRHAGFPRLLPSRDRVEGFPVRRTPLFASHSRSAVPRFLNYGTWAASAAALGRDGFRGADAALVYSSPATAALPALWQRTRRQVPYVLMVQDVWPDSVFAAGFLEESNVRRVGEPLLHRFVDATYRRAHAVAVIAPGMKDLLVSRGVPADKVHVVFNWVDEQVIKPLPAHGELKAELGLPPDDLLVMYAGNHGPAQGLGTLVDAMRSIGPDRGIHLAMVGDGIDRDSLIARASDLPHVHFLAARAVGEMSQLMAGADVQIVSLRDEPLFRITLPGKVQSIMAAGRPMMVLAPGDAAAVVNAARAGLVAKPGSSEAAAAVLIRLRAMSIQERERLGAAARQFYETEMSEDVGSATLIDLLTDAARCAA